MLSPHLLISLCVILIHLYNSVTIRRSRHRNLSSPLILFNENTVPHASNCWNYKLYENIGEPKKSSNSYNDAQCDKSNVGGL